MPTALYQLELDQSIVNCGMSYVIQLSGGGFVLIDGGYFTEGEADRLYRFLSDHSVGPPVIKAWYFSHAHQDHVGNFIQFIHKFSNSVTLEKILYAFHPVDFLGVTGDWKSNDPATVQEFYKTVEKYCTETQRITLHAGDLLNFNELSIEVIYTYEDLYPTPAAFNDYSTVIATTVGDQRALWLGDVAAKASEVLLEHPEKLVCDIVQVSHHGIDNYELLCDLYAATKASVALWPAPDYNMVNKRSQLVNQFVLNELGIREHLCSGYGTVMLPLPYSLGEATKLKKALSLDLGADASKAFVDEQKAPAPFRYLTPDAVTPSLQDNEVSTKGN